MIPQAVLMRSGIKAVNTAKPKDAHNAVKRNRFNTVKASACWVWMPKNRVVDHVSKNNASVTLKRFDYIDAQGRFKLRGGKSAAKTKDNDERQRISRAEDIAAETLVYIRRSATKAKDKVAVRLQAELDKEERQRISRAEGLIQELLQKIFMKVERSRR
ncbi:hypothetical protein Tco_1013490 [Tanacetum coccineum]